MSELINQVIQKFKGVYLTDSNGSSKISQTREILTPESRDIDVTLLDCYLAPLLKTKTMEQLNNRAIERINL